MENSGGSRVPSVSGWLAIVLVVTAAVVSVNGLWDRFAPAGGERTKLPLGTRVGDFEVEWLNPNRGKTVERSHASALAAGCKVLILANSCPSVLHASERLAGAEHLEVRGELLPLFWVVLKDSESASESLRGQNPKNLLRVSRKVWRSFRVEFTPEFFILDAEGFLVARGWPSPDFLRSLPDAFQQGFSDRCSS